MELGRCSCSRSDFRRKAFRQLQYLSQRESPTRIFPPCSFRSRWRQGASKADHSATPQCSHRRKASTARCNPLIPSFRQSPNRPVRAGAPLDQGVGGDHVFCPLAANKPELPRSPTVPRATQALKILRKRLPTLSIVFFGDSERTPLPERLRAKPGSPKAYRERAKELLLLADQAPNAEAALNLSGSPSIGIIWREQLNIRIESAKADRFSETVHCNPAHHGYGAIN